MSIDILDRASAALGSLDTDSLVSCYAEEFVLEDASQGQSIDNSDRLKEYYDRLFSQSGTVFSDISFFRCGNHGAGEWTWSGLSNNSNEPFSIRGASLFVLDNERIVKEILFYDPRSALT